MLLTYKDHTGNWNVAKYIQDNFSEYRGNQRSVAGITFRLISVSGTKMKFCVS